MYRKIILLALFTMIGLSGWMFFPRSQPISAEDDGTRPLLILYSDFNFTGRSLEVTNSLLDLPQEEFDWNDAVRSIRVVRGTWRVYQHGRCNTELDETPVDELDISGKAVVPGWSCLLSPTSSGPLDIAAPEFAGVGFDISSVELVSEQRLPDWAAP